MTTGRRYGVSRKNAKERKTIKMYRKTRVKIE